MPARCALARIAAPETQGTADALALAIDAFAARAFTFRPPHEPMRTIFQAPLRRRIARWLAGVMLLCALHPVLALGLAPAQVGGAMQICTGAGMVWLAPVAGDTDAIGVPSPEAPSPGAAALAATPCPLCASFAHLAPPRDDLPRLVVRASPATAPVAEPACPHHTTRVILDAPTRGPPDRSPCA